MSSVERITREFNESVKKLVDAYNLRVSNIRKGRIPIRVINLQLNEVRRNFNIAITALRVKFAHDLKLVNSNQANQANQANQISYPTYSSKNALLIGINYDGQLAGCINDINNVCDLLITNQGFNPLNIHKISDDMFIKPTRDVILSLFTAFIQNAKNDEMLFFAFSGHGSYTIDLNGDEIDGRDELIVASDFKRITDDELSDIIRSRLNTSNVFFALFDSCFSGTVLDLKYHYFNSSNNNELTIENNSTETTGTIIMISGCSDTQTSADAYIDKTSQGAMTWSFIKSIKNAPNKDTFTWSELIMSMRRLLSDGKFTQLPQLSSNKFIDVNKPVFKRQ